MLSVVNWVGIVLQAPLSIFTTVITLILCVRIIRATKSVEDTSARVRLITTSILTTASYSLSSLLCFAESIREQTNSIHSTPIIGKIGIAMYLLAQTTMILVFTIRVDTVFRNTTMAYSQSVILTLYTLCAFIFILYISITTLFLLHIIVAAFYLMVFWVICYVLISLTLVYLFIRKMDQKMINTAVRTTITNSMRKHSMSVMTPQCSTSTSTGTANESDNTRSTSNLVQFELVRTRSSVKRMVEGDVLAIVTKHALLVPIAVASSFVFASLAFGLSYMVEENHFHHFVPFAAMWCSLDGAISSFCNFLLFGCNEDVYRPLCWRMHQLLENCELWHMKETVNRKLSHRNSTVMDLDVREEQTQRPSLKNDEKSLSLVQNEFKAQRPTIKDEKSQSLVQNAGNIVQAVQQTQMQMMPSQSIE